jgi:hypothetical protein
MIAPKARVIILGIRRYWGTLGETTTSWIQIVCVPLPGQALPPTPTISYIKGESLQAFGHLAIKLRAGSYRPHEDAPPVRSKSLFDGVVTLKFDARSGAKGEWFVVAPSFCDFKQEEIAFAQEAKAFWEENSRSVTDGHGTKMMVSVQTPEEAALLPLIIKVCSEQGVTAPEAAALIAADKQKELAALAPA